MRKPAFSLIETVVTSGIMVMLSVLTLSSFSGIARVQATATRGQTLTASARSLQELMINDFRYANKVQSQTTDSQLSTYAFFISRDTNSTTGEWRVYCSRQLATNTSYYQVYRLRFSVAGNTTLPGTARACTVDGVRGSLTALNPVEEMLLGESVASVGKLTMSEIQADSTAKTALIRVEAVLGFSDEEVASAQNQLPVRFNVQSYLSGMRLLDGTSGNNGRSIFSEMVDLNSAGQASQVGGTGLGGTRGANGSGGSVIPQR